MNDMSWKPAPDLEVLRFVPVQAITRKDFDTIAWGLSWGWDGTDLRDLALDLYHGRSWLWRAGEGVVVTSLVERVGRTTLFLDVIAGDGMIPLAPLIAEDLRAVARYYSCTDIACSSRRKGVAKVLAAVGFTPVATHYSMEVR